MRTLLRFSRGVDAVNTRIGQWVAWAVLAAILVSAVNATVRKLFNSSSNAWLEIQWVLFGAVFLLCAAWTLLSNERILQPKTGSWIGSSAHGGAGLQL